MIVLKIVIKTIFVFVNNLFLTAKWLILSFVKSDLKNYMPVANESIVLNVLGNGPSLSEELINMDFHEGDFCVVNRFYESPYYKIIKPQYYVLADPYFFTNWQLLEPVYKEVDWPMTLFVSYSGWKKQAT